MIINDIDLGGAHPFPGPQVGQVIGSALIEGSRTIVWPRGRTIEKHDVSFWVTAWQGMGGGGASSFASLRYMLKAVEELSGNPDMQPVYIQWTATAQGGQYNAVDPHDGWYVIDNFVPDYTSFIVSGWVKCKMTASFISSATPSTLRMGFAGGALTPVNLTSTTVSPMIALPIGSTGMPNAATSRTGGEGAIPLSVATGTPGSLTNPLPFQPPGTVASLFTGGCRVYDTINTGSNPVPTGGTFSNANWVEVRGLNHDFVGDCIVTNGLLLLLYQTGQAGAPTVYLWNTSLGTAAWQIQGSIQYQDSSSNAGTLRTIDLDRVSREEVRIRLTLNTSAGNWAMLRQKLRRGDYQCYCEFWPTTENNTNANGLNWTFQNAQKIFWAGSGGIQDAIEAPVTMTPSTAFGVANAFGQTANGPILGWLYLQQASPRVQSSTVLGIGDTAAPAQGSYRLYGFSAVPFVTAPNLQAEAESGTLSGGFASVADAPASAGNAAQLGNGVASGAIDLFGTAWTPTLGISYDPWFRLRCTTATSTTAQMSIGIWDVTAGAFVGAVTSTGKAPNQFATTYGWFSPGTSTLSPTSGHTYQFRVTNTATTTDVWWIDEACLVPIGTGSGLTAIGTGFMPSDLWGEFIYDRTTTLARG